MRIIRGLQNIQSYDQNAVVTIGNFDGIHLGHQAILKRVKYVSIERQLLSMVILFEPQPQEFLQKEKVFCRLNSFRDKIIELGNHDIDVVLIILFNQKIASMTAETFAKKFLMEKLKVNYLVMGNDFHFGCDRQGNYEFLKSLIDQYHFGIEEAEAVSVEDERVSSTRIRACLKEGDLETAEKLLGHSYRLGGCVVHGDKRGRELGVPTANLHSTIYLPLQGVYTVAVYNIAHRPVWGVANVGRRPTVSNGQHARCEVHLFDFSQEFYGRKIQIEFLKRLRDEKQFNSIELLKKQINKDIKAAKRFFRIDK